jgi:antitoxin (DNA-binding transcriptional repressor) of toxin-antitoxin stability system
MKRSNVSELKAHLSARLAEVRDGATIIVCDRDRPIARLSPIEDAGGGVLVEEPRHTARRLRSVRGQALKQPADVLALLGESRGDA